jgi:hypothetical protein
MPGRTQPTDRTNFSESVRIDLFETRDGHPELC